MAETEPSDAERTEPEKIEPASTEPATVVVTFAKQWASYFVGEKATFAPDIAARLVAEGIAEGGDAPDPPDPEGEITPHEDATS